MFFYIWSKKIAPLVTGMQWRESEQVADFSFLISVPESYLVDVWGSGKDIFGWLASALWLTHWEGCKKAVQGKLKLLNGVTGIREGKKMLCLIQSKLFAVSGKTQWPF